MVAIDWRPQYALLCLFILVTDVSAEGNDFDMAEGWAEWGGLVQYLIALAFVSVGLEFLLYSHLGTYALMKRYQKVAAVVPGQVLSCEPKILMYEVAVLYTTKAHKHEDIPRLKFRYPNAFEERRFLRRLETKHQLARGSSIEILILPEKARSGLTRDMVERIVAEHSHFRTVLILVPGILLILFIAWMAVDKASSTKNPKMACIVFAVAYAIIFSMGYVVAAGRFEQEKQRRYFSAIAQKTKHQGTKNEPLLVVQGVDV